MNPSSDPRFKAQHTPMANLRQIQFLEMQNEREPFVEIEKAEKKAARMIETSAASMLSPGNANKN